jgi:hypothetical protein
MSRGPAAAPAIPVGGTVEVTYNPAASMEAISLRDAHHPPDMMGLFYVPLVAVVALIILAFVLIYRTGS